VKKFSLMGGKARLWSVLLKIGEQEQEFDAWPRKYIFSILKKKKGTKTRN